MTMQAMAMTNGAHGADGLSGVGRSGLEDMIAKLRESLAGAQVNEAAAVGVAARAESARALMEGTLTATQAHCTQQLNELRIHRGHELDALVVALARGRSLHPKGCYFYALVEEVGEIARAIRREGAERAREELLDTAVVAIRLYLGEAREPLGEVQ